MKKIFYILLAIVSVVLISCGGDDPQPEGNARLSIRGITFVELFAAEKLTGTVVTKTYVATDTSSSLIVNTSTNKFNITSPEDFNQFYDYNLPNSIKKITFDISFNVTGTTAKRLKIDDVNFTFNGSSLFSRTNLEFIDESDEFVIPTVEVNF